MTHTKRLRITSKVPLHGRLPGSEFDIDVDVDGVPVHSLWRRRLQDEEKYRVGAVEIVTNTADLSASTSED
jgi:hypothetical protein